MTTAIPVLSACPAWCATNVPITGPDFMHRSAGVTVALCSTGAQRVRVAVERAEYAVAVDDEAAPTPVLVVDALGPRPGGGCIPIGPALRMARLLRLAHDEMAAERFLDEAVDERSDWAFTVSTASRDLAPFRFSVERASSCAPAAVVRLGDVEMRAEACGLRALAEAFEAETQCTLDAAVL